MIRGMWRPSFFVGFCLGIFWYASMLLLPPLASAQSFQDLDLVGFAQNPEGTTATVKYAVLPGMDTSELERIFQQPMIWERDNLYTYERRREVYEEVIVEMTCLSAFPQEQRRALLSLAVDQLPVWLRGTPIEEVTRAMAQSGIDLSDDMTTIAEYVDGPLVAALDLPQQIQNFLELGNDFDLLMSDSPQELAWLASHGIPFDAYSQDWVKLTKKLKPMAALARACQFASGVKSVSESLWKASVSGFIAGVMSGELAMERLEVLRDTVQSHPGSTLANDQAFWDAMQSVRAFYEMELDQRIWNARFDKLVEDWPAIASGLTNIALAASDYSIKKIVEKLLSTPIRSGAGIAFTINLMLLKQEFKVIAGIGEQFDHAERAILSGTLSRALCDHPDASEVSNLRQMAAYGAWAADSDYLGMATSSALSFWAFYMDWDEMEAVFINRQAVSYDWLLRESFIPDPVASAEKTQTGDAVGLGQSVFSIQWGEPECHWSSSGQGSFVATAPNGCNVEYTPSEVGAHVLKVRIASQEFYRIAERQVALTVLDGNQVNGAPYFSQPSVTPQKPLSGQPTVFSVVYNDDDLDPVDDGTVLLNLDSSMHALTSGSLASGTRFSSQGILMDPGDHTYSFTGKQNGIPFRLPASGSYSITVADASQEGLSAWADPASLSACGTASATIHARLIFGGQPISGAQIAFVDLDGGGYVSTETAFTDSQGLASATWTPRGDLGIFEVGVVTSGHTMKIVEVEVGGCPVDINPSMSLHSCSVGSAVYDVEARVLQLNGEALQNQDAVVTVRDTAGNLWGSLRNTDSGAYDNPLDVRTDNWGDLEAELMVAEDAEVVVTIECMGASVSFRNTVRAGCASPETITPFLVIPNTLGSNQNDGHDMLDLSPDGETLALIGNRYYVRLFDLGTTSLPSTTPFRELVQGLAGDEDSVSVAFSPSGAYLATGWGGANEPDEPGLTVYNTADWSVRFNKMVGSDDYSDAQALAWKPDSTAILVAEDYDGVGGRASVWNMSGSQLASRSYRQAGIFGADWAGNTIALAFEDIDDDAGVILANTSLSPVRTINSQNFEDVNDVAFSPDGNSVALAINADGVFTPINIYDLSANLLGNYSLHPDFIYSLDWHPSGAMVSAGREIIHWDALGNPRVFASGTIWYSVRLSPSGQEVWAMASDGRVFGFAPFDAEGPGIVITGFTDGATVHDADPPLVGSVSDPHYVSSLTLTVNDGVPQPVAFDPVDGSFALNLTLALGDNSLELSAVDGCGNVSVRNLNLTYSLLPQDFVVSIDPVTGEGGVGDAVTYAVSVEGLNGFSSDVSLSLEQVPLDASTAFSSSMVSPGNKVSLSVTPGEGTAGGLSRFYLVAQGGGITHKMPLDLICTQPCGGLAVHIIPEAAVSDGAMWRIQGDVWRSSGRMATGLPEGPVLVELREIDGWETPGLFQVGIEANATVTVNLSYAEVDTDLDGIPDSIDTDDDNDGIPDSWEIDTGLDSLDADDALLDSDGDGFTNLEEYRAKTAPFDPNSHPAKANTGVLMLLLSDQ